MKKTTQFLAVLMLSAAIVSCGNKTKTIDTTTETTELPTEVMESAHAQEGDASAQPIGTNNLLLEGNDAMNFLQKEFKVKAGEEVTLTLKHVGTMGKNVMGHNFVLLKPGTDISKFGLEAAKANTTDYVPLNAPEVIAHTKVIGGGEQDTVKFTLEPGTYEYICSFPGHYSLMKGKIIAE